MKILLLQEKEILVDEILKLRKENEELRKELEELKRKVPSPFDKSKDTPQETKQASLAMGLQSRTCRLHASHAGSHRPGSGANHEALSGLPGAIEREPRGGGAYSGR